MLRKIPEELRSQTNKMIEYVRIMLYIDFKRENNSRQVFVFGR
jgi:hypothetical protein